MSPSPSQQPNTLVLTFARIGFIAVVVSTAVIALAWWMSQPAAPDAFYRITPLSGAPPGSLLRSMPFTRALPDGARAWRILYTTTRSNGSATLASAIVVTSASEATAPRPVVAWAHGTTGIAAGCAPSMMANPYANVPAVAAIVREGWAYVATDYAGLGTEGMHAYLSGEDAARSVLDALRAARQMENLNIDRRFVVWGHSQGGNSALWTGIRTAGYAPEVDLLGVAALAPATDLGALVSSSKASLFGKIVSSLLVHAYSAVYSDVRIADYVPAIIRPIVADIASRCVGERDTLFSVAEAWLLLSGGIFERDPFSGPLGQRLRENTPLLSIQVPVLIAQGQSDDLVLPEVQRRYVEAWCAAGQPIDFRLYPGLDHISLVGPTSPLSEEIIAWSRERFAGAPASDTCKH